MPIPMTFDYLCRQYMEASEAVDDYDVRDENDPTWVTLVADMNRAKSAVYLFVLADSGPQQEEKQ